MKTIFRYTTLLSPFKEEISRLSLSIKQAVNPARETGVTGYNGCNDLGWIKDEIVTLRENNSSKYNKLKILLVPNGVPENVLYSDEEYIAEQYNYSTSGYIQLIEEQVNTLSSIDSGLFEQARYFAFKEDWNKFLSNHDNLSEESRVSQIIQACILLAEDENFKTLPSEQNKQFKELQNLRKELYNLSSQYQENSYVSERLQSRGVNIESNEKSNYLQRQCFSKRAFTR